MVSSTTYDQLHRQRARRVKKAERDSGFKEGRYTLGGMMCDVRVSFYPDIAWWLDEAGKSRRELTQADWDNLVPYPALITETDNG